MAKHKTHEEDCLRVFGFRYKEVHEWLDEYAKKYNVFVYSEYHRKFRHHRKGVEEVKEKFGYYASQAAKLHIIRDYEMYLLKPVFCGIIREEDIDKYFDELECYYHKI